MKNKIFRFFLSVTLCSLALMSGCAKEEEQRERAYIDCGILESESENESNHTILTSGMEVLPTITFTEEQKLEVYDLVKRYQRSIERAKKRLPEEEIIVGQGLIDGNKVLLPFSDELCVLNFRNYNPKIAWHGGRRYGAYGDVTLENGQCQLSFSAGLSEISMGKTYGIASRLSYRKEYEVDGITYQSEFYENDDRILERQSWCYYTNGSMYIVIQDRSAENKEDLSKALFTFADISIANSYGYFGILIYPKEDSMVEKITPKFLAELKISLYPIDPEKPIKSRAISVDDFSE